ncbi:MAG: YggS family pyridoxal phosphate-dependent enzyme [Desulfobacteraceae bacterium]|nr:YggS family pyridoxal phosphate-dependent enzyme [Desulfobacteraceae bacterium]
MRNDCAENYAQIRAEIPDYISIVVAAKSRTAEEITAVIQAGASDIGENYVQEAANIRDALGERAKAVKWHLIGPLQKNKINKALLIFDVIQTIDSYEKAQAIDKRVQTAGKASIPICIEINIGNEDSKAGLRPQEHEPFEEFLEKLIWDMSKLGHLRVEGLMTMGPRFGNPEDSRPYFRRMKAIYQRIKDLTLPHVDMRYLSMGMTNSYRVAIEEGSNMVRIGTAIFGERKSDRP